MFNENSNPIPLNDDFAVTRQLQGLVQAVDDLQQQIKGLSQTTATVARAAAAGSMINLFRNSNLDTSDAGRRNFTYTAPPDNATDVLAFWYAPDSASTGPFTDSDALSESPEAIAQALLSATGSITTGTAALSVGAAFFDAGMVGKKCIVVGAGAAGANLDTVIDAFTDSTHVTVHDNAGTTVSGDANVIVCDAGADVVWYRAGGTVWYGGAFALMCPLQKNFSAPGVGNNIFIIFNARLNPAVNAAALTSDYQFQLSVFDNTVGQQKIIEGAPITVTATLDRGTGSVIRHYVVRYFNASGDTFLSSVSSAASVSGTPSPTAADPGQVTVTFPVYAGTQSVQVFRSDDSTSLSDFYLIDTVSTGIDNIQDNGGKSGAIYAFTDDPWLADAIVPNIGAQLTTSFQAVSAHILTPATYNFAATDPNSQWFRLVIRDAAGSIVAIPEMALEFDFFGFSYRSGTWIQSADDQQAAGDSEATNPNPSGGLPTGGGDDPGGGGSIGKDGGGFLPF